MKRLLLPITVLVVLVGFYLATQAFKEHAVAPGRGTTLLKLNPSEVDRVTVSRFGTAVELKKVDNVWSVMVDGLPKPADTASVNNTLLKAVAIPVGSPESDNPAKQAMYQVDSITGTKLSFFAGERLLGAVYIGKSAQNYADSYVRMAGSDEVYLARELMSYQFNRPANSWRDRVIVQVDTGRLSSVMFDYPEGPFSLIKVDSVWFAIRPPSKETMAVNPDSVAALIRFLADLRTDDFLQPTDTVGAGFDQPELRLSARTTGGIEQTLILAKPFGHSTRYYLKRSGLDEPFVLNERKHSQLARRLENFVNPQKKS